MAPRPRPPDPPPLEIRRFDPEQAAWAIGLLERGRVRGAAKLGEAAEVLARYPTAGRLRYVQTMREVASERNITTTFCLRRSRRTIKPSERPTPEDIARQWSTSPSGAWRGRSREGRRLSPDLGLSGPVKTMV